MARGVNLLPRLLVLWLLAEQPQHGYGIARTLRGEGMAYWFPIDDASIYAALRTLVAQGWARALRIERAGKRPARTRYAITPTGRVEYTRLLTHALTQPEPPHGLLPIALAAQPDLGAAAFAAGLAERAAALEARLTLLDAQQRAVPAALMLSRERALIHAELDWCRMALEHSAQQGSSTHVN
jgi:DNA-binding PadR family transcriptional regulator